MEQLLLSHPVIRIILYLLAAILLSLALLLVGIRLSARGQSAAGLLAGGLSPCPDTPNCVCSEMQPASSAYIDPLEYADAAADAWRRARQAVVDGGGEIVSENDGYLWATYTSRWLHFVDDVELRLDPESHLIHMRSASRLGKYDFHVNRKRLERLRSLYRDRPSG